MINELCGLDVQGPKAAALYWWAGIEKKDSHVMCSFDEFRKIEEKTGMNSDDAQRDSDLVFCCSELLQMNEDTNLILPGAGQY